MKRILCNKYEVLRPIAEGGMGAVFLVKDLHLNRLAAVKVSHHFGKEGEGEAVRAAVFREREVLKKLSHPALPGIIDYFEEGNQSFLVMEYVEGITLEQYLRKFGRIEVKKAVKWTVELTEVLRYLHEQNPPIIYRDLKPANIMIQPDGTLRLVDFGAAGIPSYGRRKPAFLFGTPGYGAPELWEGKEAGKTCDIYSIGAVLHEMLTGIRPGQSFAQRRPVREYDRSISGELQRIILTCTAERKAERYQTMERLKDALLYYEKRDLRKNRWFGLKKMTGILLWLLAAGRGVVPFLQGVNAESLPFPYLEKPLLLAGMAAGYHFLFLRRKRSRCMIQKQEKSIFLTEKKFNGLYAVLGILLFLFLAPLTGNTVLSKEKQQNASEELWMEMKDEKGRKLLLEESSVYKAKDRVRFEIPAEELPEKTVSVWLIGQGEEGEWYQSRRFLLQAEKK